ncbi:MAG TPA: DUF4082 domain-containing protein [Solirubrobacterales bacterium]|jgi:hypothetical protein
MTEPIQSRRAFFGAAPVFVAAIVAAFLFAIGAGVGAAPAAAAETGPCAEPIVNPIVCENSKEGDNPEDWQIDGIGDESIQGFATAMSVNPGETEQFKINTNASRYNIRILRLGYYKGDGARVIEPRFKPSASLPQKQPPCRTEEATGLVDCGTWAVSASWKVPANAVSGLYIAELEREDTHGMSQIFFVVKNESSHAPIVLKTSDATWQAYNEYGKNSLYSCNALCPPGNPAGYKAAYAVSYNRPFDGSLSRDGGKSDPFYAEYQMMRWLEKEGYNITYLAQTDIAAHPELLKNHKVAISSGHDEYWSAGERAAFESAREAGVNLAFFSGNEVFWKTRWGPSTEGNNVPDRTLITYKETHFTEPVDPEEPKTATSSWQDPRFTAGGAGRPQNELTGQLFFVNEGSSDIKVPGSFAKLRFWKHTQVESLTPSQTLTLDPGGETLGYEWDVDPDNGFRPAGRIPLSSTTVSGVQTFKDYGTEVVEPSIATHSLSLYRAPSGALVFGAGTVQWAWGLEYVNAWSNFFTQPTEKAPDKNMEQATVNLLAEMGAQPGTLETGLFAGTETTDHTPPTATVTTPAAGATVKNGEMVTVSGTATDTGGGVVAAVEVSTDGGKTWHPASGTTSWNYAWNADGAKTATLEARAIDDSANIGAAGAPRIVNVMCPCSALGALTPAVADAGDGSGAITLGMKFQSEISGTVNGVRFFKAAANTGTHVGALWTATGEKLAEATFTGETSTGWQKVEFAKPVPIKANTTYIVGYLAPKGHYSDTQWQMSKPAAVGPTILEHKPLRILADVEGGNGLFAYGSALTFPNSTYRADNYWVDALFSPAEAPGGVTNVAATAGVGSATVSWTGPTSGAPATTYKITPYIGATAQTPVTVEASQSSKVITGLTGGTTYTFTVTAINEAGTGPESAKSNAVTPTAASVPGAPTGVTATAGAASATVNWTAPTNNGGSAITSFKITPYKLGVLPQTPVTAEASATSTTVSGLTVGVSYTFTVAATNAVGTGAASSQSNSVTPTSTSVPGAPTGVTAAGKTSGALLSWTAPTSNGGSAITGYKITPFIGSSAQTPINTGTTTTSATVSGLTNGVTYTFRVAAINALGTGAESAPSAAVTPYATIFELATPATVDSGDGGSVELGVKFNSETAGTIEGIRFYKAAANLGTHIGTLWTATGGKLAEATFTGESASGWQQVKFASPVPIAANTTYVASYLAPAGHYSANGPSLEAAVNNPPLHAIASGSTGGNGVYAYGASVTFPKESFNASNYWVDVLFAPPAPPAVPGQPTGVTATAAAGAATVRWTAPSSGGAPTSYTVTPYKAGVAQTTKSITGMPPATETTISGLTAGASYTFTVTAANGTGSGVASGQSNSITIPSGATAPAAPTAVSAAPLNQGASVSWTAPNDGGSPITGYKVTPFEGATELESTTVSGSSTSATIGSLTNGTAYTFKVAATNAIGTGPSAATGAVTPRLTLFEQATPATIDVNDPGPVVLGVRFNSSVAGKIAGIRFYKAAANVGPHVVGLWDTSGIVLEQTTATSETASGWQEVLFPTPVSIAANTDYIAGYLAPKGHYSVTSGGFAAAVTNGTLTGVADGAKSNGLYAYSSTLTFPNSSFGSANYFVDVVFTP